MKPRCDDEVCAELLALPREERAGALDRECGDDPDRRARIGELLEAHDLAGGFLAGGAVAFPLDAQPGDVIGPYTLEKKLGEGGCGTVFLAEQSRPVRRRVAFKVIKLGMDTREVIARFEGERQALAMMEHPAIASVFDAGATESGRPYFVMEYVDGRPITKFCDQHRLTIAARLELFSRVCLALQHAHQKGIIHRDIKPSNILVALQDKQPKPKVIDFGIAKATQEKLTEHTMVTRVDQFMGTPAYMSPEQADRRDHDIDTRSDVYALGVLLYELLAGRLPFDAKTLNLGGVDEIRRAIRDLVPKRPSARLAALADGELAAVAQARGTAPGQLIGAVKGDLDWIVLRCLEKDRARRYGSAQDLADDVHRHLNNEPVEARPPTVAYRTGKFVSRNRLACASAAAIAFSLVAGTVVSVRQAVRATRAAEAETVARTDAQRRQEQAEDLLTFMLGDFRTELKKIGRLQLLDAVGEKAMAYFAALDTKDLTDTELARQAKALTQIGEIRMDQARYDDAHAAFTTAYDRAAALAARHPENPDMLFERSQAEYWMAYVARMRGHYGTAREWCVRYRDSAYALAGLDGDTLRSQMEISWGHHNLAVLEFEHGSIPDARLGFEAALKGFVRALAGKPDDSSIRFQLADSTSWLGSASERDGDYAGALAHYGEYASHLRELIAAEPTVAYWQLRHADSFAFVGDIRELLGQREAAAEAFASAATILESLVARDSSNRQWRQASLNVRLKRLALRMGGEDFVATIDALRAARGELEALVAEEPTSRVFMYSLAMAWRLEARALHAAGRPAAEAAGEALRLGAKLASEARADYKVIGEYAQAGVLAGRVAASAGEAELARSHWGRTLEFLEPRMVETNNWRVLDPAAQALTLLGKTTEARPLIERLRRCNYHNFDPLAAALLGASQLPVGSTPNR